MGIPMKRSVWTASLNLFPSFDMKIGNGALSKAHERRARSVTLWSSTKHAPTILLGAAPSPLGFADKLSARKSCSLIMFAIERRWVFESAHSRRGRRGKGGRGRPREVRAGCPLAGEEARNARTRHGEDRLGSLRSDREADRGPEVSTGL